MEPSRGPIIEGREANQQANQRTMLYRRNSSSSSDHVEAEQAARAARKSQEKLEKEAAAKKVQDDENIAPKVEWGSHGVASLVSDDVAGTHV